jgi:DNA gyrase/topoisomerase IV subunit B
MTGQDQDGSHIKDLLINFIHYKWLNWFKYDYTDGFITPILKVWYSSNTNHQEIIFILHEFLSHVWTYSVCVLID